MKTLIITITICSLSYAGIGSLKDTFSKVQNHKQALELAQNK